MLITVLLFCGKVKSTLVKLKNSSGEEEKNIYMLGLLWVTEAK